MYSHCRSGGWIFGHLIHGLQAEYAGAPFADTSLYRVPEGLTDEQVLFLANILPTSYECDVVYGWVRPGDSVVIVRAGPVGLASKLEGPICDEAILWPAAMVRNRERCLKAAKGHRPGRSQ